MYWRLRLGYVLWDFASDDRLTELCPYCPAFSILIRQYLPRQQILHAHFEYQYSSMVCFLNRLKLQQLSWEAARDYWFLKHYPSIQRPNFVITEHSWLSLTCDSTEASSVGNRVSIIPEDVAVTHGISLKFEIDDRNGDHRKWKKMLNIIAHWRKRMVRTSLSQIDRDKVI